MNTTDFLKNSLTFKEKAYGLCWLLFELCFFPALLQWMNRLLPTPLPQVEVNFIFFVVNFLVVILLFRRYLTKQLRLLPDVIEKALFVVFPGFVVYQVASFLMALVIFAVDSNFASVNDVNIQGLVRQDYRLMFVGSVILVPFAEECLFRGLVFRGIYDHSPALAWIVSVLLFSAIHVTGYIGAYPITTILLCFIQYIPAGVCLAGAYRISGSLLSPILIHALVNCLGMLALR